MRPEQLKASILQYAIQGKLVEHRPEEGSAEELYQKIQEEKQKLIKEGKIKKEKPLAEIMEDEIPFDIPESWMWVRLGKCGCFERGSGIKKDEVIQEGFPCVRYGQLYTTYKTRFEEVVSHVPLEIFDKCHKAHKNDILMALTGENEYDIALAVTYEGDEEIAMGGDMTKFFNHCMNPIYLTYVINSRYGILCKSKMASGNIIVHISNDKLATIPIPLPPLEEQNRIVAKIEELLPYVDRYAEAYEKLEKLNAKFPEDMKKSILQYAIQGKLVEQRPEEGTAEDLYQRIQEEKQKLIMGGKIKKDKPLAEIAEDEIPFDIPGSWKWVKLGTLFAIERGSSPRPIKDYLTKDDDGVNWIKIGDSEVGAKYITNTSEKITPKGAEKSRKVEVGDFIISNSMSFGRPYIMAIEGYVHDGWNIIHFITDKEGQDLLFKDYIYYILSSDLLKQQIISKAAGGVVLNIRSDNLKELIVPIPPMEEQKRIVIKIEQLLPYCNQLIK